MPLDLTHVGPNTPLRLGVAASLAFPDGSMSASGLRREAARGRLVIERIAGKDFTTLANIERMRELCRVEARGQAVAQKTDRSSGTVGHPRQWPRNPHRRGRRRYLRG